MMPPQPQFRIGKKKEPFPCGSVSPPLYLWLSKETDTSSGQSPRGKLRRFFVCRAPADHTRKLCRFQGEHPSDVSLQRHGRIIRADLRALLEGTTPACPAPYITVARGHRERRRCRVILVQLTPVTWINADQFDFFFFSFKKPKTVF